MSPPLPPLSRRTFLAAGLVAVGAAACGKGDGSGSSSGSQAGSDGEQATSGPDQLELEIATAELVATPGPQRLTVGILQDAEPMKAGIPVEVAIGYEGGKLGPWQPAERHDAGIPEKPYYKLEHVFDRPGNVLIAARAGGAGGKTGAAPWQVIPASQTQVPLPGQPMIPVATPTITDHRGVEPICTRRPACPFHSISLDDALKAGKPVAALFATPAFCQSRTCGPVTDVLVNTAPAFADKMAFIHVEVFAGTPKNFTQDEMSPGMKAYHLSYEPILFLAGADGVVKQRLLGTYDEVELKDGLTRLTAA